MAKRNKLAKFADVLKYSNVVENFDPQNPVLIAGPGQEVELNGKWASEFFNNANPITLELACGRGEYSLALGRCNSDRNYLGVDIKGARIWRGATNAIEEELTNVGFLRTKIELIDHFFSAGEVDEIWITFPDPFHAKPNRRLTNPRFLDRYRKFVKDGGTLHLKTDDDDLYEYSLEQLTEYPHATVVENCDDIYSQEKVHDYLLHKTYYERMHLEKGKTIKYIKVQLSA